MAGNFTNEAEIRVLDWLLCEEEEPERPAFPLLAALYTATPDPETGIGGTEVDGDGYARVEVVFAAATSPGSTSNTDDLTWEEAEEDWGEITHVVLFDSDEVMLFVGEMTAPKEITAGKVFQINAGAMSVSLD